MYFYKDIFASMCFITFGAALAFHHPYLYFAAMMCGALSRTAVRKQWKEPAWAGRLLARWDIKQAEFFENRRTNED